MSNPSPQMRIKVIFAVRSPNLLYPKGEAIHKKRSIDMKASDISDTCSKVDQLTYEVFLGLLGFNGMYGDLLGFT